MEQKRRLGGIREKSWGMTLSGLALVGLLGGCGGGGGSVTAGVDPAPTPSPTPAAVSGVVADGYLQGATVCLDVNLNKACDTDEPTALTGTGGKYTLDAAALALLPEGTTAADYPVLVNVPATAIDEDTMAAVGKEYVLAAPAGKPEFVSPMTTLVQNQIESNPALTAADAETLVKEQIGVSADSSLFEDYVTPVAANKTPGQIEELARVHKVAQVVATTLAGMQTELRQAASTAGQNLTDPKTLEALTKLVADEVMNRLQVINATVATALATEAQGGAVFNPQTVATAVAVAVPVDTSTVVQKIEEKQIPIIKSSFAQMLEGDGTYWLEHWIDYQQSRFEYGNVKLPAGANVPVEAHYNWVGGSWQADSGTELPDYILTAAGWQEFSEGASNHTVTFNLTDGTALLTHTASGFKEKLSATEFDLAGKTHLAVGGQRVPLSDPAVLFPAGAKGYKLTFTPQQDVYAVDTWTNDTGVDQNFVRYWNQELNQEVTVTSLTQLLSVFAKDSRNYLHVEGNQGFSLMVQFGSDGKLYCFKQAWNSYQSSPQALAEVGSWAQATVFDQALVKLSVPKIYWGEFEIDGHPFFVVKDGGVKHGEFSPAGMMSVDKGLNFNKTAFDSLAANVNYNYVLPPGNGGGTVGGTDPGTGGGTDPGTGGGTDPGTGGGITFVDPPPAGDIMFISPGEFMDRTFVIQESPEYMTFGTFLADGTVKWTETMMSMNGNALATNDGTWSVNLSGHLELVFPGAGSWTIRKLQDSTSAAMHVYSELKQGGQLLRSSFEMLESTVPFSDPSGLTLVGSDGVTVVFNPAGSGNSGLVTDSLDNSSNSFDWNLQDGVLTLYLDNGEVVTLYLLQNGSTPQVFSIVGSDRDATGALLDVFHDVMTVVSEGGAPQ